MIDRQSVGPVRTVPEPADSRRVWRITREDGRWRDIEHLDPLTTDATEETDWTPPPWLQRLVAVSIAIVVIAIAAVLNNY
jgi:hypothetical protein